jgi:hypothetical protein
MLHVEHENTPSVIDFFDECMHQMTTCSAVVLMTNRFALMIDGSLLYFSGFFFITSKNQAVYKPLIIILSDRQNRF